MPGKRREPAPEAAPAAPEGTRYSHVFVLPETSEDWTAPEHDDMHAGNKASVLQTALNHGLHPRETPRFDGAELIPGGKRASTRLAYSVAVVPATGDPDPDATVTPGNFVRGR